MVSFAIHFLQFHRKATCQIENRLSRERVVSNQVSNCKRSNAPERRFAVCEEYSRHSEAGTVQSKTFHLACPQEQRVEMVWYLELAPGSFHKRLAPFEDHLRTLIASLFPNGRLRRDPIVRPSKQLLKEFELERVQGKRSQEGCPLWRAIQPEFSCCLLLYRAHIADAI